MWLRYQSSGEDLVWREKESIWYEIIKIKYKYAADACLASLLDQVKLSSIWNNILSIENSGSKVRNSLKMGC